MTTNLDRLISRLDAMLGNLPNHLLTLGSIGAIVFGLWIMGHTLGAL